MPYNIDPEIAPLLATVPELRLVGPGEIPRIRRERAAEFARLPKPERPAGLLVADRVAPGIDGDVPVRVYTPERNTGGALLYIHGGGFILGNVEMTDPDCAAMAARLGIVVVSVEYRLAPECPYPAGVEDCYSALAWLADRHEELGVDPARIGVGGASAGGGLAAAVALLARDRGGPPLRFQMLGIPELDDRLDTHSMVAYTDTPLWNRPNAEVSWQCYLGEKFTPGGDDVPVYAAPARAEDLTGLPPAYVEVCEFDPLRDEGLIYAQRLVQAGVPVELHMFPGTFHGSALMAEAAVSKRMRALQLDAIGRALGGLPKPGAS